MPEPKTLKITAVERFIAGLSSEFINLAAERIDSKVNRSLSQAGKLMNIK